MPMWTNRDMASGNGKPLWANTANVYGVNTTEAQAANNLSKQVSPGWVQVTRGTGYVVSANISNAGSNITVAGYVTITGGGGTGMNIAYGINNISNTVNSYTIRTAGEGYVTLPTANVANTAPGYPAILTLTMGGRFNRNTYETLVFVKSMTSDDAENTLFPNT